VNYQELAGPSGVSLTGITNGYVLFNNAGALGGRAPTGTGTAIVTGTGTFTSGDCLKVASTLDATDQGAPCGVASLPVPNVNSAVPLWFPAFPFAAAYGSTGTAFAVNTIYLYPVYISTASTLSALGCAVKVVGSANFEMAVYADALDSITHRHQPQNIYASLTSGQLTDTSIASVTWTFGSATSFTPGIYWIGFWTGDTTLPTMYAITNTSLAIAGMIGSTSLSNVLGTVATPIYGMKYAATYSTTWPNLAGVTLTELLGSDIWPNFAYQIAHTP